MLTVYFSSSQYKQDSCSPHPLCLSCQQKGCHYNSIVLKAKGWHITFFLFLSLSKRSIYPYLYIHIAAAISKDHAILGVIVTIDYRLWVLNVHEAMKAVAWKKWLTNCSFRLNREKFFDWTIYSDVFQFE